MSRVANSPVDVPGGVTVDVSGQKVSAKGPKGNLEMEVNSLVNVVFEDNAIKVAAKDEEKKSVAMAGTMRALLNNVVTGVTEGFEKKLELRGVGYRAQAQGDKLNLTLGFSHPVVHSVPAGVKVETPSQTEIVVSGIDKQAVGQVAADIRSYRPPEPYKGKGVRYVDEYVAMKEAKKK
jgi:large subunit ribosomal protein L6